MSIDIHKLPQTPEFFGPGMFNFADPNYTSATNQANAENFVGSFLRELTPLQPIDPDQYTVDVPGLANDSNAFSSLGALRKTPFSRFETLNWMAAPYVFVRILDTGIEKTVISRIGITESTPVQQIGSQVIHYSISHSLAYGLIMPGN